MSDITIKNKEEIEAMREGGKRLAGIMNALEKEIKVGMNTLELDKLAEKLVFNNGGKPAFKGYGSESGNPFPATLCTSKNNEVVHGVPKNEQILKEGDILKLDIGMKYDGMFVDMARTFPVGSILNEAKKIIDVTRESLEIGISKLKNGNKLSEYSKAVQKYVEKNNFSVIRKLVGHGVGHKVHEDPQIPNFHNRNYQDMELETGMTLALEPMVNAGDFDIILGNDGWTYKTKDGKLSAHFEDTVLITEDKPEILTRV